MAFYLPPKGGTAALVVCSLIIQRNIKKCNIVG
nr:MAG TPA: hypothetical protein [Caudoviricetes sp.]